MDFNKFYENNFSTVQLFCQKWAGNVDDARDIAQESFVELLHRENNEDSLKNPLSWVLRVAYNRCVNRHRFSKRFVRQPVIHHSDHCINEGDAETRERIKTIRKAMQRLNDREKALVTLYKLGFSYGEMARVIEMNPASVGKTLTRAIDKLAGWVK